MTATASPSAQHISGDHEDGADRADALFRRMREASRRDPPPNLAQRREDLAKLRRLVLDSAPDFAKAIDADFGGRSHHETYMAEVAPLITAIDHSRRHLGRWMRPRRASVKWTFLPARNRILFQPKGVVLIVAPWNYPLLLSLSPVVDALAAGNRVILKPSEFTPRTSALLAAQIAKYFPETQFRVLQGKADLAAHLTALPFDHILFTGATAVGRKVMAAAAQNLTPVTLELGGKSPALIHDGFPLATAVERIARGKLLNAGQTCLAPDYVLLPRARLAEFRQLYERQVARFYPDLWRNPQYSAIIDDRHFARLSTLLDDAKAKGAKIHTINPQESQAGDLSPNQRKMPPILLTEVTDDMAVMQEEIFGPLLPLVPYDDLGEALNYIAARPRPLALYYFDTDKKRIRQVLSRTVSGGVSVNDTILHVAQDALPFGGIGDSGMGAYHGEWGFRTFSHEKAVFLQPRLATSFLLNPPYGRIYRWLMKLVLGRTYDL